MTIQKVKVEISFSVEVETSGDTEIEAVATTHGHLNNTLNSLRSIGEDFQVSMEAKVVNK